MTQEDIFGAARDVMVDVNCAGFMPHAEYGSLLARLRSQRPKAAAAPGPETREQASFLVDVALRARGNLLLYLTIMERQFPEVPKPVIGVHGHWPRRKQVVEAGSQPLSEAELQQLLPETALLDAEYDVRIGFLLDADKCLPVQSLPIKPDDPTAVPYDRIAGQRYDKLSGEREVYSVIVEIAKKGWWVCASFNMKGRISAELLRSAVDNGTRIAGLFVGSRAVRG